MKKRNNDYIKYTIIGVGVGIFGLGLQHMNPSEPRMIIEMNAVILGMWIMFLGYWIFPLCEFVYYGLKEKLVRK